MSLNQKPSKRERFGRLFGRSPSSLQIRATVAPARTPSPSPAYTRNGSSILADALEGLEREDREIIRTWLPANVISVDTAFDEVYGDAKELQQQCADKRWSWNYKGRHINLSDQVDKVVQLLDKFKSVADVVANVDPVHFGLPWAGIRAILEVCARAWNVSSHLCTNGIGSGRLVRQPSASYAGHWNGVILIYE